MEGPSIVVLTEECSKFIGKAVVRSSGKTKSINVRSLKNQKLQSVGSWGKHFILQFNRTFLRIHFMMFGSYTVDKPKEGRISQLTLKFSSGSLFTYACAIKELTEDFAALYDWRTDVMSAAWDEKFVEKQLAGLPSDSLLCDALLDQKIFTGAGNIFKNEVLFELGLHPECKLRTLSKNELRLTVRAMRRYALKFYIWKKQFALRKNWKVYKRKYCANCRTEVIRATTGKLARRSHYCPRCQKTRSRVSKGAAAEKVVALKLRSAAREVSNLKRQLPSLRGKKAEKGH